MDGMIPYLLTCIVGLWPAGTSAPPFAITELDHCYTTPLPDQVEGLFNHCQNWNSEQFGTHPRYGWKTEFIRRDDTPEFEEMIQQKEAYYAIRKYTTIICAEQAM